MSTVDTVSSLLDQYGVKETTAQETNDLNKDAFLNLLVTQMQYQDPLQPTNDKEFLAQMAQFSALEQMQNLNSTFTMSQATKLIDKYVQGTVTNEVSGETTDVVGIVDAVNVKNGEPFLRVSGQDVPLASVTSIISDFGSETRAIIDSLDALGSKVDSLDEIVMNMLTDEQLEALLADREAAANEAEGTETTTEGNTDNTETGSTETKN